jgi:hypothetical protein
VAQDPLDLGQEPHVGHAVGLVDDHHLEVGHVGLAALDEVDHAARRGHHDIDALAEGRDLAVHVGAAVDGEDAQTALQRAGASSSATCTHQLAGGHQRDGPGLRRSGSCSRRWSIGSPKASVLPEPVLALPHTSRPGRASAMVRAWTGTGPRCQDGDLVEADEGDRLGEPPDLAFADGHGLGVHQQRRDEGGGGQHLVGLGEVAQPGRQVHRLADVVVALEQQHRPPGDAGAQRQRGAGVVDAVLDVDDRLDQRLRLDTDEHRAVAEPLGDAHTPAGRDLAHRLAEQGEHRHGGCVALVPGEGGEPRQVDEGEGAVDPGHAVMVVIGKGWTIHGLPNLVVRRRPDPRHHAPR